MKRMIALAAAVVLCLTACGKIEDKAESKAADKGTAYKTAEGTHNDEDTSDKEAETGIDLTEEGNELNPLEESGLDDSSVVVVFDSEELPAVTGAELTGYTERSYMDNVYERDMLATGLVGLMGCPVSIELGGESAVLYFDIDENALNGAAADNLIILGATGDYGSYDELPSVYENGRLRAEITESSTYMVADNYQWYSAWGEDMSGYEHPTVFTSPDFDCTVTLPDYVAVSSVSDYWHSEYNGFYEMMEHRLMHQNNSSDSAAKAEFKALRYPNDEDGCKNPAPYMSFDDMITAIEGSVDIMDNWKGEVLSKETLELSEGRKGCLLTTYFPEVSEYGYSECTNVTGYYQYSDDTYLVLSFAFMGYDAEAVAAAEESVLSFTFTDRR